eukprot:Amastigsp_a524568_4.p3 type:complete len:194 gc:universal Amastigsp_a524568_4:834-253(-)
MRQRLAARREALAAKARDIDRVTVRAHRRKNGGDQGVLDRGPGGHTARRLARHQPPEGSRARAWPHKSIECCQPHRVHTPALLVRAHSGDDSGHAAKLTRRDLGRSVVRMHAQGQRVARDRFRVMLECPQRVDRLGAERSTRRPLRAQDAEQQQRLRVHVCDEEVPAGSIHEDKDTAGSLDRPAVRSLAREGL